MQTIMQADEDEQAASPAATPRPDPAPATLPSRPSGRLFDPDTPTQPDLLSRSSRAAFLADVILHPRTGTPLCLGLFGRPGSGKSTFLNLILRRIEGLSPLSTETPGTLVVRLDAEPGTAPLDLLTRRLLDVLRRVDPKRAAQVGQAGSDPHAAARQAGDRLSDVRTRLDSERQALDDLTGRRTRLADTVLFETAGSRVDAYARANRSRIERGLQRFGFTGEPLATFKQLVRDASEPGGALAPGFGGARAFFSYLGQTRLIVTAIVLFVLAWGLGYVLENQAALTDEVRSLGDKMAPVADWAATHAFWLGPLRTLLVAAGFLAVALNILRAVRFLQPIARGVTLMRQDVDARSRELDTRLAQQTKRVDTLARDADRASQQVAEAEARIPGHEGGPGQESLDAAERRPIDVVLAAIQAWLEPAVPGAASQDDATRRIVVALDGLDRLTPPHAADMLRTVADLLRHPGFVTILAVDREQLATGLAEADPASARAMIDRIVQIPVSLDAIGVIDEAGLAQAMLGLSETPANGATEGLQDRPWQAFETPLIDALAPLAGGTPRGLRRFVNLYRLARLDPAMSRATAADFGMLALVLAGRIAGVIGAYELTSPAELIDAGDESFADARRSAAKALDIPAEFRGSDLGLRTAQIYEAR